MTTKEKLPKWYTLTDGNAWLFFVCYFAVPLKSRLLYYFPHILAEYNTWINILHIFILRFVPKKNAVYRGIQHQFFFQGLADGLLLLHGI